jgi:hypothetical protein
MDSGAKGRVDMTAAQRNRTTSAKRVFLLGKRKHCGINLNETVDAMAHLQWQKT